jgi:hypothetical protein
MLVGGPQRGMMLFIGEAGLIESALIEVET